MTGSHEPLRPSWECGCCGEPWPCPPARVELGERFVGDPAGLATRLMGELLQAAREMPTAPAAELHERFVAWTR
jgi:hypothetical protein